MRRLSNRPIIVQSDFDGTVTKQDVSFLLLDTFGDSAWRSYFNLYHKGEISVNEFNRLAFSTIKEARPVLEKFVRGLNVLRPGLVDLVNYCNAQDIPLVIVSNGLDFYIETLLKQAGINELEVHSARAEFTPAGIVTTYQGPNGESLDSGFKEAYTRHLLNKGYYIVYMGNGPSDIASAMLADRVFATESLEEHCERVGISYTSFNDLKQVASQLNTILGST